MKTSLQHTYDNILHFENESNGLLYFQQALDDVVPHPVP